MRLKTFLFRIVIPLVLIGLGVVFFLLLLGIDSKPLVLEGERLTEEDIDRIKQQLEEHDPRQMLPGQIKHLAVTERDLNLFSSYASSRILRDRLKARVELYQGSAYVWSTFTLPFRLFGPYLNVSGMLSQRSGDIVCTELHIGSLPIPRWVGNLLMRSVYRRLQRSKESQDYAEVIQAVKEFRFQPGRLLLVYQWRPEMMTQIQIQGQSLLLSEDDQERLRVYNDQLVEVAQHIQDSRVSLATLFRPLFGLAFQRAESGEDPISDNRVLVLLLALYANKQRVREFLNSDDPLAYPHPRQVNVTLSGREDLALHFLISAAITASTDSGVAEALGVFKELDDSKGGSGFSFADLAADRAGIRFAELATGTRQDAHQLQRRVSQVKSETEFMPRVDNLPEGIMALELKQEYGNLDSASYRMINAEVDRRIAACWLYY